MGSWRNSAILVALAFAPSARAEWTATDADPVALARVEVAQARGADQPAFLEISCLRGTSQGNYGLRAELRIARAASGLPPEATRRIRRLGRDCPGPITEPSSAPVAGAITLSVGRETIATRAGLAPVDLESEQPIESRADGPCTIATHELDPAEARLTVEGRGETATRYLVELLMAEHRGEMTLEVPEKSIRQAFPVAGAAGALSTIRRLCGWENPSGG